MKDNNPEISIIVPVFNSENYVKSFISCVFSSQNMPEFELIFVDDGSSDRTVDIIKHQLKLHSNIKIYTQKHLYQSEARNLGIKHARGKYLSFLDVDDEFSSDFFQKMVAAIDGKKLVISGIYRVINMDKKINESTSSIQKSSTKSDMINQYLTHRVEMDSGVWNKLFKTEIIKKEKMWFVNKNFLEDTLFVFKYLTKIEPNDVGYINEPIYFYKRNDNTTTTIFQKDMDELAKKFVFEIKNALDKCEINARAKQTLVANVQLRTFTYVLHRHILDDASWDSGRQKEFCDRYLLKTNNQANVSTKYRMSMVLAYRLPLLYRYLYKTFKRNR